MDETKKPIVSLAEAAAKIDPSHLKDYLDRYVSACDVKFVGFKDADPNQIIVNRKMLFIAVAGASAIEILLSP